MEINLKNITMFIMETCPYCRQALAWMEDLKKENTEFCNIDISIVDENKNPVLARKYDYYLVPAYYVDGKKVHEGVCSKELIRNILFQACQQEG
jgi:thioredoxin 1